MIHFPLLWRRTAALSAIVLLIALLMLPNLIWLWYAHGVESWIQALLLPLALLMLLFAVLGDVPWLACLLLVPFAALAPLEAFYVALYHHPTSSDVLATLVATNPRETREYLGHALLPLALCITGGVALTLLAAWCCVRSRWRNDARVWVLLIVLLAPLASLLVSGITAGHGARLNAMHQMLGGLTQEIEPGYPFGVFQRIADYRYEWKAMRADAAKLDAFHFHAHRAVIVHRRQVYVLVIGEASRRDHWQLFGYDRPTNPELSRLPNLVLITDMLASWPESITAIPMILTRRPPDYAWNKPWREASILRAMQEAGYETYWISNQLAIGKYDSPVSMYAYEAQHVEWLNHASWTAPGSYDGDLIQPFREALHNSDRDLFIVLHMMGSHESYDYRYPPAFERFRPIKSDSRSNVSLIERTRNSYDNTILYTDHVLGQIIGVLRDSHSVSALWFESDHGETLPSATCNHEGHGIGTRWDFQISALFWYSDAYASVFPARVAALRANADKRTLSADTFESLIDMAGVDYPGHVSDWSLFDPRWHYRTRWVNGMWQTDFDQAAFGKGCQVVLPPH